MIARRFLIRRRFKMSILGKLVVERSQPKLKRIVRNEASKQENYLLKILLFIFYTSIFVFA
jgi:hypothetical protein